MTGLVAYQLTRMPALPPPPALRWATAGSSVPRTLLERF